MGGDDLPEVVPAPPLDQQQEVEGLPVRGVVFLKIVVGMGHEPLELRRKQQVGHDVAAVVGGVVGGGVADGQRQRAHAWGGAQGQLAPLEGVVDVCQPADTHVRIVVVVVVDEEQAVGHDVAVLVEHHKVVDARGEAAGVDRLHTLAVRLERQRLEHFQRATAQDRHGVEPLGVAHQLGAHRVALQPERHAPLPDLGKVERVMGAVPLEVGRQGAVVRNVHLEGAAAHVGGPDRLAIDAPPHRNALAHLVGGLEGDARPAPRYEVAALGVERHREPGRGDGVGALLGAGHHVLHAIVAG